MKLKQRTLMWLNAGKNAPELERETQYLVPIGEILESLARNDYRVSEEQVIEYHLGLPGLSAKQRTRLRERYESGELVPL